MASNNSNNSVDTHVKPSGPPQSPAAGQSASNPPTTVIAHPHEQSHQSPTPSNHNPGKTGQTSHKTNK